MTFHFIIISYVQFHFRDSTILYNVCRRRYYTYKKTKCKTEKNHRHENSLLLICTQPIVHCVVCSYYIKKYHAILFKKIKLSITEATCANSLFTALIVTGIRLYHKLIQNSSKTQKGSIQESSSITFSHKNNGARARGNESITKHSNITSYHKYAKYIA